MIDRAKVLQIGRFNKPHGVKGELSASFDYDIDVMETSPGHILVMLDGLLVPFTILGIRPKSADAVLLTLKGIGSEAEAATLAGAPVFLEKDLVPADGQDGEDGVVYLEDLVGYALYDGERKVGLISGYDDSTDNVLFIVDNGIGDTILVPAADDLIDEIDEEQAIVRMSLPDGIIDL